VEGGKKGARAISTKTRGALLPGAPKRKVGGTAGREGTPGKKKRVIACSWGGVSSREKKGHPCMEGKKLPPKRF